MRLPKKFWDVLWQEPSMSKLPPLVVTGLSLVAGLLVGAIALLLSGYNPLEAYATLTVGTFAAARDWSFVIIRSTPLILTGLSVAFAFRTGLFNIGAEGQFIMGALGAALVGVLVPMPAILHIPLTMLVGVLFGALWGGLSGVLKARWGINEVISTIMLNWIALYLNNSVVMLDGFRREHSEASNKILDTARLDFLGAWKTSPEGLAFRQDFPLLDDILRTPANFGIVIAILAVILIGFVLEKTVMGYRLKAVGFNKEAAAFSGISVAKSTITAMAVAGALAGLAGALQVQGVSREVARLAAMEGMGFDGIAVALIGFSQPWGVFGAALLYGSLKHGGPKLQPALGIPMEIIQIIMGSVIFFLSLPGIWQYLVLYWRKWRGNHIHRHQ